METWKLLGGRTFEFLKHPSFNIVKLTHKGCWVVLGNIVKLTHKGF